MATTLATANATASPSSSLLAAPRRMFSEEAAAPYAMVLQLTTMPCGLVTICARRFRAEQPSANAAMLRRWVQLTDAVGTVLRRVLMIGRSVRPRRF